VDGWGHLWIAGLTGSRPAAEERTLGAVAALVFLAAFIALGLAAWFGWLPDTRDPEYSLGRVVGWQDRERGTP
jgi:hypothetical protein